MKKKTYSIVADVETDIFTFVDIMQMIEKVMNGNSSHLISLQVTEQIDSEKTSV